MSIIKRFIYLGYYVKKLDWHLYAKFVFYVSREYRQSSVSLIAKSIYCVFKYNTSMLEYFQFHFYRIPNEEKLQWAGTGFMYESILRLNPKAHRKVLSDKNKFAKHYASFIKHSSQSIANWLAGPEAAKKHRKWVLKPSDGQCGRGIIKVDTAIKTKSEIAKLANATGNDLIEPYLVQHDALQQLSPSGLNTLRVITQVNKEGKVDILGIRLRITIDNLVDNLAAGNIAAAVDEKTGQVNSPGVYSDITKPFVHHHPITGIKLIGFQIPYFKESVELAREAALFDTRNTSIGWDIAILQNGPDLLEGNHDWCKLLWQLPVQKGLKSELEKYL